MKKKQVHYLKSVIEHRALTTHNISMEHWNNSHGEVTNLKGRIELAVKEFEKADGKNIDVHAWYFTLISFANIITLLNNLKYINLSVKEMIPTKYGSFEFYVVLEKSRVNN